MKRLMMIALAAAMAATSAGALAGCGSSESSAKTESSTVTETSAGAADSAVSAADTVFTYNGVSVELNSDASAALASLGEPLETSSQLTCHGTEGDDKTFKYTDFTINTYPLDGQDRVLEIVVTSPNAPTSKGIKVGDTAEAVKAAYGDKFDAVGTYYAYKTGDGKSIQFLIVNDVVEEIDYYYDV